jgi:DNA polymerase-1
VSYTLVTDQAGLAEVVKAIEASTQIGLDTETTGLDPRKNHLRLVSVACDNHTYLVDCAAVSPVPLWRPLRDKLIIGHNLVFDLLFLATRGFEAAGGYFDTMLASQVLEAEKDQKGKARLRHDLSSVVNRRLGQTIDKSLQLSDWSGDLSREQLEYATRDVEVLRQLHRGLVSDLEIAGLVRTIEVEMRCLPAIAWLSQTGVGFSRKRWLRLVVEAERNEVLHWRELDRLAGTSVNWNSGRK